MRKNKHSIRQLLLIFAVSCIVYFLLDYPIRVSGAYSFPEGIGVKSFLPFSLGLFLGPCGAAGCALGAILAGLIMKDAATVVASEILSVLIIGIGKWCGWFLVNRDANVRVESKKDFITSLAMDAALSVIAGAITAAFLGKELFLPTMAGYMISGMLVGTLVNILLGGIFCVDPVLPPWSRYEADVHFQLQAEPAAIAMANEMIEEKAFAKKIPMKRVFEIQNCFEELFIRICKGLPQAEIKGRLDLGTTISMRITVPGEKCNPLQLNDDEDEMDVVSLKLIRHRALRASYSYKDNENHIHIIV